MSVARTRPRFSVAPALIALAAMLVLAAETGRAQTPEAEDSRISNPAMDQLDIADNLFPGLLEMGLDVVPSDDQASSVLAAVNNLRKQDKQRPFAALDADAASYVEGKLAAYRTQRLMTIRIQGALEALGFDPGPIDGLYGPLTTEAVRRYQRSAGMPPIGVLTAAQVDALEMQSIDRIMRVAPEPSVTEPSGVAPSGAEPRTAVSQTMVASPALAPDIDPALLDAVGR